MKTRWLALLFTLFSLIVWRPCGCMADEISFTRYMHSFAKKGIPYVWGAADEHRPEVGLDCSGALYVAARKSGALVHRTTALEMWKNPRVSGWTGRDVGTNSDGLLRASEGNAVWWTWGSGGKHPERSKRPYGHIGVITRDTYGSPAVVHASQSRGRVVVEPISGRLLSDITGIRKLNIWKW